MNWEFLPEIDAYLAVNSHFRACLQDLDDREGGDPQQFTLIKLKRVALFDLDHEKSRLLIFESGYRIITASNTPNKNRAIEAVTTHLPLVAGIVASDRNRADLD